MRVYGTQIERRKGQVPMVATGRSGYPRAA